MSQASLLAGSLPSDASQRLSHGLAMLEVAVSPLQHKQLAAMVTLLHRWNRAYNLTAVRSATEMVSRHILDSAAVFKYVKGPRLIDVGSGPGFPGLVFAILDPTLEVTLVDSNGKKVRFQRQVVMELGLENVIPCQARVENLAPDTYDQVVSRAFASLADFIEMTRELPGPEGEWLAMKGPGVDEELPYLPACAWLKARHLCEVPFDDIQRHVLILSPQGDTL